MATTQRVTAVLRKTGATFSQYTASGQVRGWGTSSAGYRVRKWNNGQVRVEYEVGWQRVGPTAPDFTAQKLDEAETTLKAAGLTVRREDGWLIVGGEEARDG